MNAYGSETDALDLFERDVVGRPVVKLGRARRLVGRDVGGRLKGAPIFQINGDAGGAEAVVGNAALEFGCFGAALDDTEGVDAAHALGRELVGAAARGAEEGSFGVLLQADRRDVGVEVLLGLVMARDLVIWLDGGGVSASGDEPGGSGEEIGGSGDGIGGFGEQVDRSLGEDIAIAAAGVNVG